MEALPIAEALPVPEALFGFGKAEEPENSLDRERFFGGNVNFGNSVNGNLQRTAKPSINSSISAYRRMLYSSEASIALF